MVMNHNLSAENIYPGSFVNLSFFCLTLSFIVISTWTMSPYAIQLSWPAPRECVAPSWRLVVIEVMMILLPVAPLLSFSEVALASLALSPLFSNSSVLSCYQCNVYPLGDIVLSWLHLLLGQSSSSAPHSLSDFVVISTIVSPHPGWWGWCCCWEEVKAGPGSPGDLLIL